jgi:hypothetical protein
MNPKPYVMHPRTLNPMPYHRNSAQQISQSQIDDAGNVYKVWFVFNLV